MKKLIICAGALALAACNSAEAPEAEEAAAQVEAPAMATLAAGMYEVTLPDGSTGRTQINADGTYADINEDGSEGTKGAWTQGDGQTCFTPTDGEQACWTDSPVAADGSWTATGPQGETVTIKPMAAEPAA